MAPAGWVSAAKPTDRLVGFAALTHPAGRPEALRLLRLLPGPLDEVEHQRGGPGVGDAVGGVGRGEHHRAGSDLGGLAVAEVLAAAALDDHDLLLDVGMGGVGRLARVEHESAGGELRAGGGVAADVDAD